MTASSTYGQKIVVPLTNKSGGSVALGDVVVVDTTNNDAFTTTTSASTTNVVGVAMETIANNAAGRVCLQGYISLVNVNASVTRGNYGVTHTVAKQATDGGSSRTGGTFCKFLTGGTTPDAIVFNPDLSGAALTNPMNAVGDIIQGTTAGAPARLGAGTTGYFLMAKGAATSVLWAARELDYVQITSDVNVTATTAATGNTIITGNSVAYDGATVVMIEFCSGRIVKGTTFLILDLWEDSTDIARIAVDLTGGHPCTVAFRRTPSNASHTYKVTGYVDAGTGTVYAGAGGVDTQMPAYLRVTRAI